MSETRGLIDLGLAGKRGIVAGAGYRPSRAGNGRLSTLRLAEAGRTWPVSTSTRAGRKTS